MARPEEISEEFWNQLTEEEREALEEEEGEEDEDGDDDDDEDEGEGEGEETGDDDAAAAAAAEAAAEAAGDEGEGDESESAEKASAKEGYNPLLRADLPADIEEKIATIATKREELEVQFDDGELTTKEYRQSMGTLDKEERGIEQQQFKAQIAVEMEEQQERAVWMDTVRSFLDENTQYEAKPLLYENLDRMVILLAKDPANKELTGEEMLNKAHTKIYEDLGIAVPAKEKKAAEGKKAAKKVVKAVPTLGALPSSDTQDPTNVSKYARLDRLLDSDPVGYEAAFDAMSEKEQERYLAQ